MRVEYFGLPGTGKSYLCRELIQYYENTGASLIKVSSIIEDQSYLIFNLNKLRYSAMFLITHPRAVWRIVGISKKHGTKSKSQYITKLINLFAELRKSATEKGHVVIEQGVIQAVWSLEMLSQSDIANELLDEVLNWLPAGVILVEPPDYQFYVEQLSNREQGRSHFDTLNEEEIKQSLDTADKAIQNILELTDSKKADLKVLRLVNDHRLDVAVTGQWISAESGADTALSTPASINN